MYLAGSSARAQPAPNFVNTHPQPQHQLPGMQLGRRIILILFSVCSLNHATKAVSAITASWHHPSRRSWCSCTLIFQRDISLYESSDDRVEVKVDQKNIFKNYESNSYDSGFQVLKTFYNIHGHLVIPRSYEVPYSKGPCVLYLV